MAKKRTTSRQENRPDGRPLRSAAAGPAGDGTDDAGACGRPLGRTTRRDPARSCPRNNVSGLRGLRPPAGPAGASGPGNLARLRRRLRVAGRTRGNRRRGPESLRARRGRRGAGDWAERRLRSTRVISGAFWKPGRTCVPGKAWPNAFGKPAAAKKRPSIIRRCSG